MRESLLQFMFTNCLGLCPPILSQFTLLQPKLAKKLLKPLFWGFKAVQGHRCWYQ